jgi:hypothetical protein
LISRRRRWRRRNRWRGSAALPCTPCRPWEWPEAEFDVVVGIFFQYVAPAERGGIFAGMRKALKPGGLLLIEGYGPKQLEYKTGGPSELEISTPTSFSGRNSPGSPS